MCSILRKASGWGQACVIVIELVGECSNLKCCSRKGIDLVIVIYIVGGCSILKKFIGCAESE